MKTSDIVIYGGLAALAYYVVAKFGGNLNAAADSIASDIATGYVDLTSGPSAQSQLQGQVIMPDGSYFSTSELQNMGIQYIGNALTFSYGGQTYSLASHDANGNYQASIY